MIAAVQRQLDMNVVLVQDTKHPNKEPFEISVAGLRGLQEVFGNRRYVAVPREIITPDKVELIKVAPVKPTKQGNE